MLKVLFVITLVALGNPFFGLVQAEVKYYVENTEKTLGLVEYFPLG